MKLSLIISLLIFIVVLSCSEKSNDNEKLISKLDSIAKELESIKKISRAETVFIEKKETVAVKKNTPLFVKQVKPPKRATPKPVVKQIKETNDPIFHYFTNKKVSVKITPWKDGKRNIYLYNQEGEITYEMEEIRHSYSQSVKLSFHKNGAVSKAEIHLNPGASMYWYETTISFNEDNLPIEKYDKTLPQQSINLEESFPSMWDKENRKWIKPKVNTIRPME